MATIKNKTLILHSGRQIPFMGYQNALCISDSLETGISCSGEFFSYNSRHKWDKELDPVSNPYNFSKDELCEIADYMVSLWMQFKENVRKHNLDDPAIFRRDDME